MSKVKYECQYCYGQLKLKDKGKVIYDYCPQCNGETTWHRKDNITWF